jgi:hypothetical protein
VLTTLFCVGVCWRNVVSTTAFGLAALNVQFGLVREYV